MNIEQLTKPELGQEERGMGLWWSIDFLLLTKRQHPSYRYSPILDQFYLLMRILLIIRVKFCAWPGAHTICIHTQTQGW